MGDIFDQLKQVGINVDKPEETRAIWRYPLSSPDMVIDMPAGAEVIGLIASVSGRPPSIYALVDPAREKTVRRFLLMSTGEAFPASARYVDSVNVVLMDKGVPSAILIHLLEVKAD